MVGLAQAFPLAAQSTFPAPQEEADAQQEDQAESQHQRLYQPITVKVKHKRALRS
jgi:hypothetical protein